MQALRVSHALLATLVVLAFISGETGLVHAWLGYGVAGVIALRLVLALTGRPQLGLSRFHPKFENLRLGTALTHPAISRTLMLAVAACTVVAVGTGIAMDKGRALGLAAPPAANAPAQPEAGPALVGGEGAGEEAEEAGEEHEGAGEGGEQGEGAGEQEEGPIGEAHEFFANLLIALVAVHVSYLLLFKRPLAKFMLFLPQGRKA